MYKDNYPDDFEEYAKVLANNELRWIGVDFDNVMARSIWPKAGIGEIIPGTKEGLDKLVNEGYKIVIFTARPWSDYENLERWCKDNELPVRRILCGKPLVRWMIDDRNIEFNPTNNTEWETVIDKIK